MLVVVIHPITPNFPIDDVTARLSTCAYISASSSANLLLTGLDDFCCTPHRRTTMHHLFDLPTETRPMASVQATGNPL